MSHSRALTGKETRFASEYLLDLNATQAAIRAGYSRHTARQIGAENLTKPDIAALIGERVQERARRNSIDADFVITRLTSELEADLADLFLPNRAIRHPTDWPKVWRQGLIEGFSFRQWESPTGDVTVTVGRISIGNGSHRLELLGKHLGVF